MAEFYKKRKKRCYMCEGKEIGYKDVEILKNISTKEEKSFQDVLLEHVQNIKDI